MYASQTWIAVQRKYNFSATLIRQKTPTFTPGTVIDHAPPDTREETLDWPAMTSYDHVRRGKVMSASHKHSAVTAKVY